MATTQIQLTEIVKTNKTNNGYPRAYARRADSSDVIPMTAPKRGVLARRLRERGITDDQLREAGLID